MIDTMHTKVHKMFLSPQVAMRNQLRTIRRQSRSHIVRSRTFQGNMHASQEEEYSPSANINSINVSSRSTKSHCYGCGVSLQISNPDAPGFVEPEKFELKQRHRQLDQLCCFRCQALSHGAMIPGVADFPQLQNKTNLPPSTKSTQRTITGFDSSKILATPEELRLELQTVCNTRSLIVLLVDLLDASGSILSRVRDLVGGNPIIVIGTKVDLLPHGTDLNEVHEWLHSMLAFKRISAVSVHLVSSKTGAGVQSAVASVKQERLGRDVYVMGAANVGKSAFIRALVKDMATMKSRQYDPQAIDTSKRLPVESAMPGTTLKLIPLDVFSSGGRLYDTPGLHLHHRVPHLLSPEENKELHVRKKLKGYTVQLEATNTPPPIEEENKEEEEEEETRNGDDGIKYQKYQWGSLAILDIVSSPENTQLVFYGPPVLRVTSSRSPIDGAAPFAADSVLARGGMRLAKHVSLNIPKEDHHSSSLNTLDRDNDVISLADIAISGIPGWIAVQTRARASNSGNRSALRSRERVGNNRNTSMKDGGESDVILPKIEIDVYAPVGVEVFVRPSIPVGIEVL